MLSYFDSITFFKQELNENLTNYPSKEMIIKKASELFLRLFPDQETINEKRNTNDHRPMQFSAVNIQDNNTKSTQLDSLNEYISNVQRTKQNVASFNYANITNVENFLISEMDLYQRTGICTKSIISLRNSLLSIPPTSIETERVFSTVGSFLTKTRSNLSDSNVDDLCILRSHFIKLQNKSKVNK